MKDKGLYNIFMLIFLSLFILIHLITTNRVQGRISLTENRTLAQFPSFSMYNAWNGNYSKGFENWFNDNIGLRDIFVKANTFMQYYFFDSLTRKNAIAGKNNWLYLMYPYMLKSYQNLDLPTQDRFTQIDVKFVQLNDYFKRLNIPYINMINLDKETIYPENMPSSILKIGSISKLNLIIDHLSQKVGVDIFSPKDALLQAKDEATVYSQNYDLSHWNNYGAFIGYLDLMNRIKKYIPDIKILSWNDFRIEKYSRQMQLYKTTTFTETDYKFTKITGYSSIEDSALLKKMSLSSANPSYRYVNIPKSQLPKLLIAGDSFIYLFMLPNIAESFSEVTFIHWNEMDHIKEIIDTAKPDMFILEFIEPAIDQFTDSVSYPNDYFAKK